MIPINCDYGKIVIATNDMDTFDGGEIDILKGFECDNFFLANGENSSTMSVGYSPEVNGLTNMFIKKSTLVASFLPMFGVGNFFLHCLPLHPSK